jgi:threonine/homoserine/homoserine lactone efflux protein
MPFHSVAAFWLLAIALIAVPGPDWAYTLGAAVSGRTVVPAVGGIVVGYLALTIVVAAGVGALVAGTSAALTALTLTGGAYLVWLGASTLLRRADRAAVAHSPGGGTATFLRGIGVSGLNPKGLLLFLALLPQFTSRSAAWPVEAQIVVLGMLFTVSCGLFYLAVGSLAGRALTSRPLLAATLTRLSGAAMLALGAVLLAGRI